MEILISKILNYEKEVFDNYISQREKLLHHLSKIKTNKSKKELLIFINDLKSIIDPIKTSSEQIDFFLNNKKCQNNVDDFTFIFVYFLLRPLLGSSDETDDSELSESELSESEELTEDVSVVSETELSSDV